MKKKNQKKLSLFIASWFIMGGLAVAAPVTDTITTGPIADDTVVVVDGKEGVKPITSDITAGKNISITMTGADNALAAIDANGKTITIGDNLTIKAFAIGSPVGTYPAVGLKASGAGSVINIGSANIEATGANSLAIYATNYGSITGSGVYNITGDIVAEYNSNINLTFESGSSLIGHVLTKNDGYPSTNRIELTFNNSTITGSIGGSTLNATLNNSHLTATKVINAESLTLNNSIVDIQVPIYSTAFSATDFASNNSLLKLKVDVLSDPNNFRFDRFLFTNATGNLHLQITPASMGVEPDITKEYNIGAVFETPDNLDIDISLLNKTDIGSYQFELVSKPWSVFGTDYWLSYTGEYSTPVTVGPNASRAMYFLSYAEMNTLIQRMGDLRKNEDKGDVWARVFSGKFDIDATNRFDLFRQEYTGVQIGIDKKLKSSSKADFYIGAMFGYTDGENDYLKGSKGDTTSYYGGIYGLYHQPEKDFFIDSVLKYGSMKNEMKIFSNGQILKDDDKSDVWSFSVEIGKRIYLSKKAKENKEGFYIEPQAQFVWGRIGSTDYNFNGLNLDVESIDTNMGRLGLLAGYEIKSGKNPINIYSNFSVVKEFDGELRARTGTVEAFTKMNDTWLTYGIGATAMFNNKHNVYLEFQRSSGGQFTQDWQINGGYRYSF